MFLLHNRGNRVLFETKSTKNDKMTKWFVQDDGKKTTKKHILKTKTTCGPYASLEIERINYVQWKYEDIENQVTIYKSMNEVTDEELMYIQSESLES